MNAHHNLIGELEEVIAGNDIGQRARILRRVTDLFVLSSGRLSSAQMALFDDVMSRLVDEIDIAARATFGGVLAAISEAPHGVVQRLALDDAISVAGPILSRSERVGDMTLLDGARTKSQAHLLAISRRKVLAEPVTDILLARGNKDVVLSTAKNSGAAFSQYGYSTLVQRSATDDELAACTWSRPDIPRQHLLQLFAEASETVKLELTKKDPRKAALIAETVALASGRVQTQARETSTQYALAHARVLSLYDAGELSEARLTEFAHGEMFDETVVALSLVCDFPVSLVEHAFVHERSEQIIVLARANEMSWDTTKAILKLQARTRDSKQQSERSFETFMRLKVDTAKKAVGFYRLRERAKTPRLPAAERAGRSLIIQ